jgi:uncharacterized membrane protein
MWALASSPGAWALETGLGLAGFVAGLLFWRAAQRGGTLPGCGPAAGCEAVAASRWARLGPIPIAALGLGLYGVLTLAALARLLAPLEARAHSVQIAAVTAAGGAALWFTFLQLAVLRRVCKFCMLFHGLGTALFIVVWLENPAPAPGEWAMGAGGVLALGVLQLLVPSKTYAIIPMTEVSPALSVAAPTLTVSENQPSTAGDIILLGGRVRVAPKDWPLLGTRDAAHTVVLLFDLTCDDCRATYQALQRAVAEHPAELAVVLVPVPLDPACNPAIAQVLGEKQTCDHTRLFLAVWQTDPGAFPAYSHWVMGTLRCPAFQDARSKMHRELGMPLSLALTAGALDLHIQKAVNLYRQSTAQKLPQLLLPNQLVVGRMTSLKDLRAALDAV